MKKITLENRACDCCGKNNFEKIWEYTVSTNTRNNNFVWQVNNVVCRNCGFAFVSPAPTEDILEEYYSDSFDNFLGQKIDYSIDNRLKIISKYMHKSGSKCFIEIGSNNCPEFLQPLSKYFKNIETVEINQSCNSTYGSIRDIPKERANIIAAYFVLEHIPKPEDFLILCYDSIKKNGRLILEVPHLYLYPKDPAGLLLHEHVNHFSPYTLSTLAKKCGLDLIEISHLYCSRPFGFAAVFKKSNKINNSTNHVNETEKIISISCMKEGTKLIRKFQNKLKQIKKIIDKISKEGNLIVIWGANAICSMLIQEYDIPKSVIFVDSDPNKKTYLYPVKIYRPKEIIKQIKQAKLLVINTKRNADDIIDWISKHTNRNYLKDELIILDHLRISCSQKG